MLQEYITYKSNDIIVSCVRAKSNDIDINIYNSISKQIIEENELGNLINYYPHKFGTDIVNKICGNCEKIIIRTRNRHALQCHMCNCDILCGHCVNLIVVNFKHNQKNYDICVRCIKFFNIFCNFKNFLINHNAEFNYNKIDICRWFKVNDNTINILLLVANRHNKYIAKQVFVNYIIPYLLFE